ncbi:MAG: clostripain-related cysteine peptidase [Candidatus Thermoplasmatota archaeon]
MASPRARLRGAVLTIILLCLASVPSQLSVHASGQDETTWTFMVYMAADSEPALPWEEDLNEMEAASLAEWMNVVVLADPLGDGDSVLLEIAGDDGPDIVSPEIDDSGEVVPLAGEVDMSSPYTLIDFVAFTAGAYPADRYALVLWGHGGGWYGMCADGLSVLTPGELGLALESVSDSMGRGLDIVIADSCAEGVLETIHEAAKGAEWYVGSEINVPAQGLRYDLVLDTLSEDAEVSPGDFGARVCEIHRTSLYYDSWSAAMAVYDLGALGAFESDLHELSVAVQGYDALYGEALMATLNETAKSDFTDWYLDMGDLLERLASSDLPLRLRYQALQALLSYHGLVHGLALYASPHDAMAANFTGAMAYAPGEGPADGQYWSLSFSSVGWGDATALVRSYAPAAENLPGPQIAYEDTDEDGRQDEAVIGWDAGHDLYTALVFVRTPSGEQMVASLESSTPEIVVAGVWGDLTVSMEAWDGGSVVSHHDVDMALCGDVEVRVRVLEDGVPVGDGVDVRVVTGNSTVNLSLSDGVFGGTLRVPEEAAYGELVSVEVVAAGGLVLGQNWTYVQVPVMHVEVDKVPEYLPGPDIPAVALAASAALIALVLAAAYAAGRARRRRRGA